MKSMLYLGLLFSFIAGEARAQSCFPADWKKVGEVTGHFSGVGASGVLTKMNRVELWQDEEAAVPMSQRKHQAALILSSGPNGKNCQVIRKGQRASGNAQFPHATATIHSIPLSSGLDLIEVISTYSHGYSQETTQLYYVDLNKKDFVNVWSATTQEISPSGDVNRSEISFKDLNPNGFADIHLKSSIGSKNGKDQIWFWDQASRSFQEKKQ